MSYRIPHFAACVHCGSPAVVGQLYCRHGGKSTLDPWYDHIQAVATEDELAAVCAEMRRFGIVLDDWPGLSREVRAKRNRLKLDAAKQRPAA